MANYGHVNKTQRMKNYVFSFRSLSALALTVILTLSGFVFTQPVLAQQSASDAMMKSMHSGMTQMMSMKMTGDPDYDFATIMRMHHWGAVEMADLEIKKGTNAPTKALASRIKAANQREIVEMTQFLSSNKPMASPSMMNRNAIKMMDSGKHSMTGNTDHDFASMMAQHHQQAIDMARAFLKEGKTAKMKTLANSIIRDQTKEIAELKKLETTLK